jgi:hypothetical protein
MVDRSQVGPHRSRDFQESVVTETTEAPIMVRVDITRDELKAIKRIALDENKSSQALLGELVRERIAKEDA